MYAFVANREPAKLFAVRFSTKDASNGFRFESHDRIDTELMRLVSGKLRHDLSINLLSRFFFSNFSNEFLDRYNLLGPSCRTTYDCVDDNEKITTWRRWRQGECDCSTPQHCWRMQMNELLKQWRAGRTLRWNKQIKSGAAVVQSKRNHDQHSLDTFRDTTRRNYIVLCELHFFFLSFAALNQLSAHVSRATRYAQPLETWQINIID